MSAPVGESRVRLRVGRALTLALVAGTCAVSLWMSFGGRTEVAVGDDRGTGGRTVALVAGRPITSDDVEAFWFERYREAWVRTLDDLLDQRIVQHEVQRLGVRLPPAILAEAVRKEVEAREKQLKGTFGDQVELKDEVQRAYGMDLADWQRRVLTPRIRQQQLLMRIVRLDTRRRPRVKTRVIVFEDDARVASVVKRLRAGADFSLTAVQESVDPTSKQGGDLPAIARGDMAFPAVEARLFDTPAGELVGPLPVTVEGRPTWHIYKVIRFIPPWTGRRAELFARLEKDLEEHPLERPEYDRWRARMRRDFGVQVIAPDGTRVTMPGGR